MDAVLPYTARRFARAIVMPNLQDPITTSAKARDYRKRILQALPKESAARGFLPLMTAYLTDVTEIKDLAKGFKDGIFTAAKLYPANATTNSAQGVSDVSKLENLFRQMEEIGMPLLIHGEVTHPEVDIFDREAVFIRRILEPLVERFPNLKIVLEHITTSDAIDFIRSMDGRVGATITPHHLILNRSSLFQGGLRPHNYCLPVAKRESHSLALRKAATSGEPWFFLGTDTAPHTTEFKEADCGCAGIFSAVAALELYATVFYEENSIENLEKFASINGPAFYGLEPNPGTLVLSREEWVIPNSIALTNGAEIKPFLGGSTLSWKVK